LTNIEYIVVRLPGARQVTRQRRLMDEYLSDEPAVELLVHCGLSVLATAGGFREFTPKNT
jgi:hypothetical protein